MIGTRNVKERPRDDTCHYERGRPGAEAVLNSHTPFQPGSDTPAGFDTSRGHHDVVTLPLWRMSFSSSLRRALITTSPLTPPPPPRLPHPPSSAPANELPAPLPRALAAHP